MLAAVCSARRASARRLPSSVTSAQVAKASALRSCKLARSSKSGSLDFW
ncbi:hypothetical protein AB0942_09575 [Streptomyces nodosus]